MLQEKQSENSYHQLPAVVIVGSSGEGKSTVVAKSAYGEYQNGMMKYVGDGNANTTSTMIPIIIDPNLTMAEVTVEPLKDFNELRVDLQRHLKAELVPEMKNCLSSRPKREADREAFYTSGVEKHLVPKDPTFRLEKLLEPNEKLWLRYRQCFIDLLKVIDNAADEAFRSSYFERLKSSKQEATHMVELLIDQILFPEESLTDSRDNQPEALITELCHTVQSQAIECLQQAGFQQADSGVFTITGNAEDFERAVLATTNSKKFSEVSAACAIKKMRIRVPGPGLLLENRYSAYCIYDTVGFDNDGIEGIESRVKEALLTPVVYDAIIYVRSVDSPSSKNRSYLAAIKESIRPSKLIVGVTKLDHAELFLRNDDEPDVTKDEVIALITQLKRSNRELVTTEIGSECRVKPPYDSDVICFANVRSKRRLGDAAFEFLEKSDPYYDLRNSISTAYSQVRRKIKKHNISNDLRQSFLSAKEPIDKIIGQLIDDLTNAISSEYGALRSNSDRIHHWTVDAILWNLYYGRDFVSHAQVWDDPVIRTYENIVDICMQNLTPIKPAIGINIEEGLDRLKKEFEANLRTILGRSARKLLLVKQGTDSDRSKCMDELLMLARKSKYNKWAIFEDLRKSLLSAVSQQDYLVVLLCRAMEEANNSTYSRLML